MLAVAVAVTVIPSNVNGRDLYLVESFVKDRVMYYATTASALDDAYNRSSLVFERDYDNRFIAVSGKISFKVNDKEMRIMDNGKTCTVDISNRALRSVAGSLALDTRVVVYGRLEAGKDSYTLVADIIEISDRTLSSGTYVFYGSEGVMGDAVTDLTADGRIRYHVPASWNSAAVCSDLTNNGISGHQYYLNAISPQNIKDPEIFYIFYFDNRTHLATVPSTFSNKNYQDIEKLIICNIFGDPGRSVKISDYKDENGVKYDTHQTTFSDADGREYRLEFVFRHDDKGIICMLYLYYPGESSVSHIEEAAYVIESIEIK